MDVIAKELFNFSRNDDDELISKLIANGAIFYCSHSSGKDSMAMYEVLKDRVPFDQIVVVHANLGEVEWSGVVSHIKSSIEHPLHIVEASKSFIQMVLRRSMWPSASFRQCTSDLKTGPIGKFIRNDLKEKGKTLAVNCMGLRAQESNNRAKKKALTLNAKWSLKSGVRTVYDWLPIHEMGEEEVYDTIYAAGKKPHFAYGERGELNTRLSCVFCIMGSKNDLAHGALENPALFATYVAVEKVIGHTMFAKSKTKNGVKTTIPVSLEDHVGVKADETLVEKLLPVIHEQYKVEQAVQAELETRRACKGSSEEDGAQMGLFAA